MHKLSEIVVSSLLSYGVYWILGGWRRKVASHRKFWEGHGHKDPNKPRTMHDELAFRVGWACYAVSVAIMICAMPPYLYHMLGALGPLAAGLPIWLIAYRLVNESFRMFSRYGDVSVEVLKGLVKEIPPQQPDGVHGTAVKDSAASDPDMVGPAAVRRQS